MKIAERIGISQRPVLAPRFLSVASLRVKHPPGLAIVGSGKDVTLGIDIQTEGVTSPFCVDFELLSFRMKPPDHLAEPFNHLTVRWVLHFPRRRTAVGTIEPTIRAPSQAVHHGMSVLESESRQLHNRITVRDVVAVTVRIKEKVRRIRHPEPARTDGDRGGNIETGDDILF